MLWSNLRCGLCNKHMGLINANIYSRRIEILLHKYPTKAYHSPYQWTKKVNDDKSQNVTPQDKPVLVSATELTFIQKVIGKFLYYTSVVNCTMLIVLNEVTME